MSNGLKYIVIAVVLWLLYAYLSKQEFTTTGVVTTNNGDPIPCGSRGGCDDLASQIPTFSNQTTNGGITLNHSSKIIR